MPISRYMNINEQIIRLYNDTNFQKIKSYYSRSTIFDVLGIARSEVIHSRFLAWTLNPVEYHQMGAEPLKKLIRLLYYISTSNDNGVFPTDFIIPVLTNAYTIAQTSVICEKNNIFE